MSRRVTCRQKSGKWITRGKGHAGGRVSVCKDPERRNSEALSGQEQKRPGERAWLKWRPVMWSISKSETGDKAAGTAASAGGKGGSDTKWSSSAIRTPKVEPGTGVPHWVAALHNLHPLHHTFFPTPAPR